MNRLLDFFIQRRKLSICFIVIMTLVLGAMIGGGILLHSKTFYPGVKVEYISLEGLEREQAKQEIENKLKGIFEGKRMNLKLGEQAWPVRLSEIGFKLLVDQALDEAYACGRSGNVFQKLRSIIGLRMKSVNITPKFSYDKEKLSLILISIKDQVDKEAESASVLYEKGNISVEKEVTGRILEVDKNLEIIENHIRKRTFNTVYLSMIDKKPPILYEDIKEINHILSSFSTKFNASDTNRSFNISLASQRINGLILFPNETFSMDKALGPRTAQNGYREAPVIFKNELVKGSGGGVCQVTTTLYDAVLKSKMGIVEREPHSMPLGYVDPGQDATIAEGYIDFKFQNTRSYPVCIQSEINGNILYVRILGKNEDAPHDVRLKSVIVEEYYPEGEEVIVDDTLSENSKITVREPKKGLKVILYRQTYDIGGELIEEEKISEDVYKPVKAQVKVGAKYNRIIVDD
ncbi:MAG: VanW family protein [Clostridia bacterium]|nr:VanW family protein [Clostridia bacterium]